MFRWTVTSWKKCMISVFVINYAYIYTLTKQSTKLFLLWCTVSFSFSLLCFVTFSSNFLNIKEERRKLKKRTNKQTNKNIKHIHDYSPRFTLSKKEYVTIRLKLEISNPFRIHSANLFLHWKRVIFPMILIKYHDLLSPPDIVLPLKRFVNVLLIYTQYANLKVLKINTVESLKSVGANFRGLSIFYRFVGTLFRGLVGWR